MSSNVHRAALVTGALEAGLIGDSTIVAELFTDDVCGWAPGMSWSSAVELAIELEDRGSAFSDLELVVAPLDVSGDAAAVEWVVTLTHSGAMETEHERFRPTGARVTLHGITVAEFAGDKICVFRQYWDQTELTDQLRPHATK
jgi:hypothetical protein